MKVTYNLNDPTRPAPLPRGPWRETDLWLDPDGDWWVRTPTDRSFYVQGPETPVNRPLWGACHSQWEQRLKNREATAGLLRWPPSTTDFRHRGAAVMSAHLTTGRSLPPGPWTPADVWVDRDGAWWIELPNNRLFFLYRTWNKEAIQAQGELHEAWMNAQSDQRAPFSPRELRAMGVDREQVENTWGPLVRLMLLIQEVP